MTFAENLKQRIEAGEWGDLTEIEKHEVLSVIDSLESYKKIVKTLEDELCKIKQPMTLATRN